MTIDPIRHLIGAFDLWCNACGTVHRLDNLRYGQILPHIRARGWKIEAGRHFCPDCPREAAA